MVLPRKPRKKLYVTINSSTKYHKFAANNPQDAIRTENGAGTFPAIFILFQVPFSNSGCHCNSVTVLSNQQEKGHVGLPNFLIGNYLDIGR